MSDFNTGKSETSDRLVVLQFLDRIHLVTVFSFCSRVPVQLRAKCMTQVQQPQERLGRTFSMLTSKPGFLVVSWISNFQLPSLSHLFYMAYSVRHCKKPPNPSFGIRQVQINRNTIIPVKAEAELNWAHGEDTKQTSDVPLWLRKTFPECLKQALAKISMQERSRRTF